MAATKQVTQRLTRIASANSVTTSRVPLAYELHSPTKYSDEGLTPIIFLHGFLGSRRENRGVSKNLSKDLSQPVFNVDLRNHGDSGHHPKHDYMEMALDVASFIESQGVEKATVIGHSMGAKTALTLALNTPHLVSKVVAVDNGPIHLPLTEEFPRYLRGMAEVRDARVKTHREAEAILKQYEEPPSVRLFLLSNFIRDKESRYLKLRLPLEYLQGAIGPLGDFPHKDQPVKFHGPILFLRALRSHYIPETAYPLTSSFFPNCKVVDVDSGHWIVQDRPEEFRRAVIEFLQSRS